MSESHQIFTASDMTNDIKNWQILQHAEFWRWIHWVTVQPHFSPKQMRFSLHLTWCPRNIINPFFRVPLLEFPSFPPKFLTWRQKATHMAWSFEQSFPLFQFHLSLFWVFFNIPIWSLLLFDSEFQPSRFLKTASLDKYCSQTLFWRFSNYESLRQMLWQQKWHYSCLIHFHKWTDSMIHLCHCHLFIFIYCYVGGYIIKMIHLLSRNCFENMPWLFFNRFFYCFRLPFWKQYFKANT